jgi:hypothetical protein
MSDLLVGVEDGADQLVLALEVVVDVPERYLGTRCNVGERRAVGALFVDQRLCALDQTLPLAWPLLRG